MTSHRVSRWQTHKTNPKQHVPRTKKKVPKNPREKKLGGGAKIRWGMGILMF